MPRLKWQDQVTKTINNLKNDITKFLSKTEELNKLLQLSDVMKNLLKLVESYQNKISSQPVQKSESLPEQGETQQQEGEKQSRQTYEFATIPEINYVRLISIDPKTRVKRSRRLPLSYFKYLVEVFSKEEQNNHIPGYVKITHSRLFEIFKRRFEPEGIDVDLNSIKLLLSTFMDKGLVERITTGIYKLNPKAKEILSFQTVTELENYFKSLSS